MKVDLRVEPRGKGWTAHVHVHDGRVSTEHQVTVSAADLVRYGAADPADLVRRSFDFLLQREPATSILPRFAIGDISRYFPDFEDAIKPRRDPG